MLNNLSKSPNNDCNWGTRDLDHRAAGFSINQGGGKRRCVIGGARYAGRYVALPAFLLTVLLTNSPKLPDIG